MVVKALYFLLLSVIELSVDWYVLQGIKGAFKKWRLPATKGFAVFYWGCTAFLIICMFAGIFIKLGVGLRAACLLGASIVMLCKLAFIPFIIIDDIRRWQLKKKQAAIVADVPDSHPEENIIPRSHFLMKAGLLAAAAPLASIKMNMHKNLYDYQVRYQNLYLPNLPKAFDGLRLGQISDIHTGSFDNKTAVIGGVEMLLKEKPDVIFFTGDLVNSTTSEMDGYQDIFSKVKAPLGVYSCLGNHDYGDYAWWPSPEAKQKNMDDLVAVHKNMGWDLLVDTHRSLKVDGEEIGILGIGNWGEMNIYPKYGRMDLATKNTDHFPVKLLLSHDPSHWRGEVLPKYPQIDAMFSGHTHGMQFGIRTKYFDYSPIKYIYNEWAGLYHEGNQQLYVNVGFGFAFTGRVGILPEITIFTLKAGTDPS